MTDFSERDYAFMQAALAVAREGGEQGEVPVGAVIVYQGAIIATGYNQPILSHDATAHAEIVAIREACQYFDNYRLPPNCELFVTLEPCTMCVGALIHARIQRVVFASLEPKSGSLISARQLLESGYYNHKFVFEQGCMQTQCSQQLSDFFKQRRIEKKKPFIQNILND